MFKRFFIVSLFITLNLYAQVSVSSDSIDFPRIFTGTADSLCFYLKNSYPQSSDIKINNLKSVYGLSDTIVSIPSNDSLIVWIKYTPNQNAIDEDLIFITSDNSTIGSVISVTGSGKFGDSYDATTFNLYDAQLKTALTQLVSGHNSLGYSNLARDKMFMEFDNQKVNGQGASVNTIECVYTGRLAVGYIDRVDAQNNYNFNTEHTWPQSTFSQNEPMRSDLYHLYPTDNPANGVRANYPFGKVVSNISWEVGGSKLGNNSLGQLVFEPRDVHKGDVSRSMFYFITRYPINYGNFLTQTQENVFREWNKLDSVGSVESARNDAIALLQLKRNPFIDHPEFVDRIFSFATSNIRPTFAELNVLPLKVNFDSTLVNNSTSQDIYIANSGNATLEVDSIVIFDSRFALNYNNLLIQPYSYIKVLLEFYPDSLKNYRTTLTVYSNAGFKEIVVTGIGTENTVNVQNQTSIPLAFTLEQNYPNPFNPSTIISFKLPEQSNVELKVYDVLGNEVATLVNEFKPAGNYEAEWNASTLPSGVYIYQLRAGAYTQMRKMLLLK